MQQFTFSFVMSALSSQRVKSSVASAAFFGAAGALRGACARLESFTRTIQAIQDKYPERAEKMRSSTTYKDLDQKAELAANRAAAIHAISEEHGVMIRLEFEPPMPKAKTQAELEQLATLTRIDKVDLTGIEWAIIGSESGSGRPTDPDWVRRLVAICREQGVQVHVKQLFDERSPRRPLRNVDAFPEDLRLRETPVALVSTSPEREDTILMTDPFRD